jgi:hypothetical protein
MSTVRPRLSAVNTEECLSGAGKPNVYRETPLSLQTHSVPSRIDLERLRLPQNFADQLGVTQQPVTVQVRRPHRQWWFRVHPDQDWALTGSVIDFEEEGTTHAYLISPDLVAAVGTEAKVKAIFTAITRQGTLFLWPVKLPSANGRLDPWNRSALEAVRLAKQEWVRLVSNHQLGSYEILTASSVQEAPHWPAVAFEAVVNLAFKDRYIDTADHSVLRRLKDGA